MKKLLLTTSLFFLSLFFLYSQEGKWEWAKLFQSVGAIVTDSWGMDICIDANDNVYIIGVFRNVPLTIGTETLTNRTGYDIFICSYDAVGNFRWAKSIGSTGSDDIAGLVIDGTDLYLAGAFNGPTVYFSDTESLPNSVTVSPYNYDSFIAHYRASDGSFLGAKRVFWGTSNQRLQDMTLDHFNNNLVVVGQFTNQLIYNNGLQDTTINPLGTKDFVFARFDLSGGFDNLQFHDLKRFYGNNSSTSLKQVNLSVIGSNRTGYFITGDLFGTLSFSGTESITGTSTTSADALVIQIDNNLNYVWSRRGGGIGFDHVNSAGSDQNGNIYLSGKFHASMTFDSTATLQSSVVTTNGAQDLYIAKYNREGRLLWLYHLGYAGNDDAFGMAILGNYLQVAGNISNTGTTNTGFIKLDLEGNYVNQGETYGPGEDVGKGVVFDNLGNTYIIGYFNSATLYFGAQSDPDTSLVNTSGTYDGFVGKYQYPLTIVQEEITNVSCNGGNNGYIRLRGEFGVPPYSWSWEHEANLTPVADTLTAGTYVVTLTDSDVPANIVRDTIEISEPDALLIGRFINHVSCFNGSNGTINISPNGGVKPYNYLWSGGSGLNPTAEDQSNLRSGSYTVRLIDANGCYLDSTFIVTQPPQLVISGLQKWDVSPCSASNGSAKVVPSGGTPAFSYLWSNGGTSDSIGSLDKGDYSVKVTDTHGCSLTSAKVSVIDSCQVNLLIVAVNNVACHDDSSGSIILTAYGGQRPYTYYWTPAVGHNDSAAVNLGAGNYEIIVADNIGDRDTIDIEVTQPSQLFASAILVDVVCFGASTGKINLSVSGGTSPYLHSWSNGSKSEDLTNIRFGNYSDTITDANGCELIKEYTILQNPEIKITNITTDSVSCIGLNDGAIDISVGGGIPPYNYYWLEKNWNQKDGLTSQDIQDLFAGEYNVKITDNGGCVKRDTIPVFQPDPFQILPDSIKPSCPGRDDGAAWIYATGGNGGYTFTWEPSGKTGDMVDNMPPLQYDVTVEDKKQCWATGTITIPENPPITINPDVIKHILCTDSVDGGIFITSGGGTAPYEWLWYPDGETTEDIENKPAGIYNVTVTDAANCSKISPDYEIEDQSVPIVILRQDATDIRCFGETIGEIVLKADGAQPFSYSIDDGTTWQTDTLFEGLSVGSYITVFKDNNSCLKYGDTLEITEPPALQINAVITNVSCNGGSDGSIAITVSGGTPPYSCSWADGPTTCDRSDLVADSYTITCTDANGCSLDSTIVIIEPTPIQIEADISNISCNGANDGSISTTISGGTPTYSCSWADGPTTCDRTDLAAGSYTLTVTDDRECIVDTIFIISEPSSAPNIDDVDVIGNSVKIYASGGTGPYAYGITGGNEHVDSIKTTDTYTNLAGAYKVFVVDDHSCTDTADQIEFPRLCCVSTEQLFAETGISLYPNPTTGKLTVEIEARDHKDINLEILNMLGQVIWKKDLQNNGEPRFVEEIDLSQQSKGTYFMRVNGLPVETKILIE